MNESKKSNRATELDKILLGMALYYDKEMNSAVVSIYHELLADFNLDEIKAACSIWMKSNRFYPKVNKIIGIIEKNRGPTISIESRAQQQWRIVLSTLGRGPFKDPITAYLCKHQFRHSYLRNMLEVNEHWEEKRWCKAFALSGEIGEERLQLEAPEAVLQLTDGVFKLAFDERDPPGSIESIKQSRSYKSVVFFRKNKTIDKEKRLEFLRKQAKDLTGNESDIP